MTSRDIPSPFMFPTNRHFWGMNWRPNETKLQFGGEGESKLQLSSPLLFLAGLSGTEISVPNVTTNSTFLVVY